MTFYRPKLVTVFTGISSTVTLKNQEENKYNNTGSEFCLLLLGVGVGVEVAVKRCCHLVVASSIGIAQFVKSRYTKKTTHIHIEGCDFCTFSKI